VLTVRYALEGGERVGFSTLTSTVIERFFIQNEEEPLSRLLNYVDFAINGDSSNGQPFRHFLAESPTAEGCDGDSLGCFYQWDGNVFSTVNPHERENPDRDGDLSWEIDDPQRLLNDIAANTFLPTNNNVCTADDNLASCRQLYQSRTEAALAYVLGIDSSTQRTPQSTEYQIRNGLVPWPSSVLLLLLAGAIVSLRARWYR